MLLYFKTSNQLSFDDEICFSTVAGSYKVKNEATKEREEKLKQNLIPVPKYKVNLLRTSVVYGANASGKSNLLRAITNSVTTILHNFQNSNDGESLAINYKDFYNRNKETNQLRPITVSFAILVEGVQFVYSFAYTHERVVEESLQEYRTQKPIEHFHRGYNSSTEQYDWRFSNLFKGEKDTVKNITNQYALYLTVGAISKLSVSEKVFDWFKSTVQLMFDFESPGEIDDTITLTKMYESPVIKDFVLNQLKVADFTIIDFDIRKDADGNYTVKTIHKVLDEKGDESRAEFEYTEESVGTRKFIGWISFWLYVISNNKVALLDEFGLNMHPLLSKYLLELMVAKWDNGLPSTAQLIFTTHDMELMTEELFRPDQIWVAEKDNIGNSKLYPLSQFKLLNGKNLKTTYLQGLYGGIPHFKTENE